MTADKCYYCHEDHCTLKLTEGEQIKCKGEVEDGVLVNCSLSNNDLVEVDE